MRSELKRRQCEEENKSTYVTNSAYLVTFVVHVCNFFFFFFFCFLRFFRCPSFFFRLFLWVDSMLTLEFSAPIVSIDINR